MAAELGGINALLSTEAQNKGKFRGSPAEPGASEAAGDSQLCICLWNLFILPGSRGTLWLPTEIPELRICPWMCEHETLQVFSGMASMEVKAYVFVFQRKFLNYKWGAGAVVWCAVIPVMPPLTRTLDPLSCLGGTQSLKTFQPEADLTCSDWTGCSLYIACTMPHLCCILLLLPIFRYCLTFNWKKSHSDTVCAEWFTTLCTWHSGKEKDCLFLACLNPIYGNNQEINILLNTSSAMQTLNLWMWQNKSNF